MKTVGVKLVVDLLVQVLKESVRSCVIDAEAVAWDTEKGEILPFQVLSTRKRKDANVSDIKVQVCVFAFDLLYLNDKVTPEISSFSASWVGKRFFLLLMYSL